MIVIGEGTDKRMDFLNGSFKIGRLFGITIRIHIFFVIWIVFQLIRSDYLEFELIFLGMLFSIVLLHEFGHCFGARSVDGDAENIMLWPLGGLAYAHAPMTPWAQFVTVASGPLVNVLLCTISGAYLILRTGTFKVLSLNPLEGINFEVLLANEPPYWIILLAIFFRVNYLLFAFNLLPIYPLDGGQLFQCLLWPFLGLRRAMTISCQVGLAGCIGLGLWSLSDGGGGMLLLIAIFGGFTCWQRLQMLKYGMIADERVKYAPYKVLNPRKKGLFAKLFKLKSKPRLVVHEAPPDTDRSDEPDLTENQSVDFEAEVDRILQKVHDKGLESLSYIERRKLERATRERQRRELESRTPR